MKILFSFLVIIFFSTTPTSQAQNASRTVAPYGEETFRQLISIQLERSLDSPLAMVRAQTLKNAVVFNTLYRQKVDLTNAIPRIVEIAKNDESLQNRRLALATLRTIGSSRADKHLSRLEVMHEDEYRALVSSVISEYYELHREGAL